MKLHLGSGHDLLAGYCNVDRALLPGLGAVLDLERPLPFRDDTVDEVVARHVLEHVEPLEDLLAELARVCRDGARLCIVVPHFSSFTAYSDITHRRFFGYHSLDNLTAAGNYPHQHALRFEMAGKRLRYYWIKNTRRTVPSRVVTAALNAWPLLYERFFCWMLPVHEVEFELVVRKREKRRT